MKKKKRLTPIAEAKNILVQIKRLEKKTEFVFTKSGMDFVFSKKGLFSEITDGEEELITKKLKEIFSNIRISLSRVNGFSSQHIKMDVKTAKPYNGTCDPYTNEVIYCVGFLNALKFSQIINPNRGYAYSYLGNAIQCHYMISYENKLQMLNESWRMDKKSLISWLEYTKDSGIKYKKY